MWFALGFITGAVVALIAVYGLLLFAAFSSR